MGNNKKLNAKINKMAIGIIIVISIAVYYNSLNTPFVFDDLPKIVNNPDIKQLKNIKTKLIYPYREYKNFERNDPARPLTYLTFTLNYHFGKLNPFGYHAVNLLIHVITAILIFFLTKKILYYTYNRENIIFPLFVALFFSVHPINVIIVTYTFGRSGGLATIFYLLSLFLFIKTFEYNRKIYILSLLFFILSILSKPNAVTFPFIVLVFDYIFLSNYNIAGIIKRKYYHLSYWIIFFSYLTYMKFYLGGIGDIDTALSAKISNFSYMITQFNVIIKYLKLLIIPTGLTVYHLVPLAKTIFEPKILLSLLFYIGLVIIIWKIYQRKDNTSKIVLLCIIWFFVTLSPTSTFIQAVISMDEKRLYLPGVGINLLLVFTYFFVFSKGKIFDHQNKIILYTLMIIHISILGITTVKRNQIFMDPVLVWKKAASLYPYNITAHNSLGLLYKEKKRYNKAITEFQKAVEIDPLDINAHNNLGVLYKIKKEYNNSINEFQKAVEINPYHVKSHYNLGLLYHSQKQYQKALEQYKMAIDINPNVAEIHYDFGLLYDEQEQYNQAIKEYKKAIELNPEYVDAYNNLGAVYFDQKKYDEAIEQYRKALRINQNHIDARNNLGVLFYQKKEYKKALREFEFLLKLKPNDNNLKRIIKKIKEL